MTTETSIKSFDIAGDMTFERATAIFESIDMAKMNQTEITINLSAVKQSDSAALAIMLEWVNQARKYQKKVIFSNVPSQLMRLIEMTRLEKILNLTPAA